MLNDEYFYDDIILSKYKMSDMEERLFAVRDSINELSSWLSFFKKESMEKDNKTWLECDQKNRRNETEYSFKVTNLYDYRILGEVRINHIDIRHNFANLTYWVRSGESGKGIAYKAAKAILKIAFEDLKLNRLEIFMSTENPGSKRIAEKIGAKLEGIMRSRIVAGTEKQDAYLYSVIPEDLV
jgi:RimJ/RimL family protein N-acetyltransferase